MRKKNLALALLAGLALNQMSAGTAVAQSSDELRLPSAFSNIPDRGARSRALSGEAAKVIMSPRPVTSLTKATTGTFISPRPCEGKPTTGSPDCRVPLATTISFNLSIGEASYQSIPGHPRWGLAPIEMAWEGKTPGEICRQIKDPARNGGRDLALLHEHVARDNLVGWAWHPGAGRRPAPGSQQQFGTIIQAWIDTGAPLKFLMRFPASAPIAQWNTIATSTLYRSTQEKIHG